MKVEIESLPPIEYSPNWTGPWVDKYRAGRLYQSEVFYQLLDYRNRQMRKPGGWVPFQRVLLDLTFIFPNIRERDEDNMIARFKPGQDALVHAGYIPNDTPQYIIRGKLDILVDPARAPLTIIEMEEASEY